ncbi:helix-turn-helix domain-containing protein [Nonomuraea sp. NPDC049480]|uniref:helix-turn-helix domain-containing protein n=1 Tax=Nonomuraea sp. NPDC049480 TaxID=3364353 RepID=UPI00378FEC29
MLGRRLTGLRESVNMTCGQVADRLKWSASKVSRIERGVNSYATAGELTLRLPKIPSMQVKRHVSTRGGRHRAGLVGGCSGRQFARDL